MLESARFRRLPALRRAARRGLAWLVSVSLALGPAAPGVAIAQERDPAVARSLERIERFDGQLGRLADALPRGAWDVDELALDLAFEEPEGIAAWVRDRVAYEPYAGLLRGPEGTLLAGAGNTLDQAVLLARLLGDAGFEARVARATLDDEAARALLAAVPLDRSGAERGTVEDDDAVWTFLEEMGGERDEVEALLSRSEANVAEMRTSAETAAAELIAVLDEPGSGEEVVEATLLEEARDYFWVEYALSAEGPWTPLHPAAPEDAAWTSELMAEQTLEDDVPAELQHRFRFQAFVERRRGSELEAVPIMAAWERPVANLSGVPLSYASVPDGFASDEAQTMSVQEAIEATTFVLPLFRGDLAEGAQLFDARGNTVPPDAAASPAAGVFQSVGGALGDAVDAVGGEEDSVALTAHWLEFTFIEPGGREVTHRRMVLDRLGPDRRAAGEGGGELAEGSEADLLAALQETHSFMVSSGAPPRAFVEARAIEGLRSAMAVLEDTLVASARGEAPSTSPPAESGSARSLPLLQLFRAFEDGAPDEDGLRSYRPKPALSIVTTAWDGTRSRTDVVANPRRSLVAGPAGLPRTAFAANVRAGTWETMAERAFLGGGENVVDTFSYFRHVADEGIETIAISPGRVGDLDRLDVPAETKAAMGEDLARGYAVVAATRTPQAASEVAWWRVDATTGETLGRGGDGRGQAAEYTFKQTLIAGVTISVFWGAAGFGACTGTGGEVGCCLADAATGFAIGLTGGLLLTWLGASAAVGIGVGFGFDFVSTNAGMADSFGLIDLIPSWCDEQGETPPIRTPIAASRQVCGPEAAAVLAALGAPDAPSVASLVPLS